MGTRSRVVLCARAHATLSGPPETRASPPARLPPRPSAAGVPLSQVPRGRPRPTSAGAWTQEPRPEAARLPKETDASAALHQALATGPPAPPPPGAAGHDGSVVPGEGLAPGGGGAGTTIPTGPTAAASLRPYVGLLVL